MSWTCLQCENLGSDINSLKAVIIALQVEVKELKNGSKNVSSNVVNNNIFDEVVQEVHERSLRRANLIVFGIPEKASDVRKEARISAELNDINNLLQTVNPQVVGFPVKPIRLGKFEAGRTTPRPIKITLADEHAVLECIRNAKKLKNNPNFSNIFISFDRTPRQIQLYRDLRKELDERRNKGEMNLAIKYRNGSPTIVNLN